MEGGSLPEEAKMETHLGEGAIDYKIRLNNTSEFAWFARHMCIQCLHHKESRDGTSPMFFHYALAILISTAVLKSIFFFHCQLLAFSH